MRFAAEEDEDDISCSREWSQKMKEMTEIRYLMARPGGMRPASVVITNRAIVVKLRLDDAVAVSASQIDVNASLMISDFVEKSHE